MSASIEAPVTAFSLFEVETLALPPVWKPQKTRALSERAPEAIEIPPPPGSEELPEEKSL